MMDMVKVKDMLRLIDMLKNKVSNVVRDMVKDKVMVKVMDKEIGHGQEPS